MLRLFYFILFYFKEGLQINKTNTNKIKYYPIANYKPPHIEKKKINKKKNNKNSTYLATEVSQLSKKS